MYSPFLNLGVQNHARFLTRLQKPEALTTFSRSNCNENIYQSINDLTLTMHCQGVVLVGATSTRVLPGYPGWKSDELNLNMIKERNIIMLRICNEKGIEADDLFNVTADHPEMFSGDKIHYTQAGYQALGTQATSFILKRLIR